MTVKLVTQDNRRHKAILVYGRINRTTFIKRNIKNTQIIDSREINEAKSLLGVIKIDKNEITHSNGILIRAMKEGFPLVIKNIDHNQRILHFLKPVIENSIITCNNMIIQAEKGFQLIFTSEKIINNRHLTVIGPFSLTYKKSIKKSLVNFPSHNKELNSENQKIIMYSILEKVYGENLNNEITREMHHKIKKFCSLKNIVDRNDFFFAFSTIFFGYLKYNERQAKENELRGILCLTSKCTHKTVVIPDSDISMTEQVRNTTNDILLLMENQIPILLVGETGVGKTHLVQTISKHSQFLLGKITKLVIVNFSSDLDINDLIGYYKSNDTYKLDFFRKRYKITIKDDKLCLLTILNILEKDKMYNKEEYMSIKNLLDNIDSKFIYQEGIFTEAIRNGYWILFDEINLASKEVLETLCAIINSKRIILFEKDGNEIINFHDNFQVFACMNPGNDHGKKDFNDCNFIKLFYDDFSFYLNDLEIISKNVISKLNKNNILQSNEKKCCNHKENDLYVTIARFYNDLKLNIENNKIKGVLFAPLLTGRTFTRMLRILDKFDLCDILKMFIYTQIDEECINIIKEIEKKHFNFEVKTPLIYKPSIVDGFVLNKRNQNYLDILDKIIKANYSILLQGPTSSGKTSFVSYLAKKYNKKLYRINNHEHTEAADYLGNFSVDKNSKISFREGVLIQAMKNGDWILLDELNLAPSEVLEILNRLLDDNKEIIYNEIVVKAHKHFRLFATQNLNYSGRKKLSKAFRNRFIEINFSQLSLDDIKEMLELKGIPKAFTTKIIEVYDKLSMIRSFNMLMTIRDIFKWVQRKIGFLVDLFCYGLNLILERQRNVDDKEKVIKIFEDVFKMDRNLYFEFIFTNDKIMSYYNNQTSLSINTYTSDDNNFYYICGNFIFTKSYLKLFNSIYEAVNNNEAVLIIGETGIGKTKIIDIITQLYNKKLFTICMHQHTDNTDFIGHLTIPYAWKDGPLLKAMKSGDFLLIDEINLAEDSVLEGLNSVFENNKEIYVTEIEQKIVAENGFNIFACMNPGNDFGKKELSPALRNRFTEIFFDVENDEIFTIFNFQIRKKIINKYFCDQISHLFNEKFKNINKSCKKMSIRMISEMVDFISNCYHGNYNDVKNVDNKNDAFTIFKSAFDIIEHEHTFGWDIIGDNGNILYNQEISCVTKNVYIGVYPYFIYTRTESNLHVLSPTAKLNVKKILKALILNKGILLKGNPGTGKTTFVEMLGRLLSKKTVRVNLCDETELTDLCGNYLPIPNESDNSLIINFIESEMVQALRDSQWVILDEINLASQSVLEGLNSALDYRREIYSHETIKLGNEARIFATMNKEGSFEGRKNLPKSFLDRFVVIDIEDYNQFDIEYILLQNEITIKNRINCSTYCDRVATANQFNRGKTNNLEFTKVTSQVDAENTDRYLLKNHSTKIEVQNECSNINEKTSDKIILLNNAENIEFNYTNRSCCSYTIDYNSLENRRNICPEFDGCGHESFKHTNNDTHLPNHKNKDLINKNNILCNKSVLENKNIIERIDKCKKHLNEKFSLRKALTYMELNINDNTIYYECDKNIFKIGNNNNFITFSCEINNEYVITHKNISNIYVLLKCLENKIPIIITGTIGKSKMVEFISTLTSRQTNTIDCHEETDINDLLGQYTMDKKAVIWKNGILTDNIIKNIQNLNKIIIFEQPEKIEKAIFDRLNSLFESKRSIFLHEKGINANIEIEGSVDLILLCDDINGLSSAIIDRCWVIELSNEINIVDAAKFNNRKNINGYIVEKYNGTENVTGGGNHITPIANRKINELESSDQSLLYKHLFNGNIQNNNAINFLDTNMSLEITLENNEKMPCEQKNKALQLPFTQSSAVCTKNDKKHEFDDVKTAVENKNNMSFLYEEDDSKTELKIENDDCLSTKIQEDIHVNKKIKLHNLQNNIISDKEKNRHYHHQNNNINDRNFSKKGETEDNINDKEDRGNESISVYGDKNGKLNIIQTQINMNLSEGYSRIHIESVQKDSSQIKKLNFNKTPIIDTKITNPCKLNEDNSKSTNEKLIINHNKNCKIHNNDIDMNLYQLDNNQKIPFEYYNNEFKQFKNKFLFFNINEMYKNYHNFRLCYLYNTYNEQDIFEMYNFGIESLILSTNEQKIRDSLNFEKLHDFYVKINAKVDKKQTDLDKIKSFINAHDKEGKIINFMKNRNLSHFDALPESIEVFKLQFLKSIKKYSLRDCEELKLMVSILRNVKDLEKVEFDSFYYDFIEEIFGIKDDFCFDPIYLLKIKYIEKTQIRFDELYCEFKKEFVNMYKYGISNIEKTIQQIKIVTKDIEEKIKYYEMKLSRNYEKYIHEIKQKHRIHDKYNIHEALSLYNIFNDIIDYRLIEDYNNIPKKEIYEPDTLHYFYFIVNNINDENKFQFIQILKKYNVELHSEFCKAIVKKTNTILEMINVKNKKYDMESTDSIWLKKFFYYDQNYLDYAFNNVFIEFEYTLNFNTIERIRCLDIYKIIRKIELERILMHKYVDDDDMKRITLFGNANENIKLTDKPRSEYYNYNEDDKHKNHITTEHDKDSIEKHKHKQNKDTHKFISVVNQKNILETELSKSQQISKPTNLNIYNSNYKDKINSLTLEEKENIKSACDSIYELEILVNPEFIIDKYFQYIEELEKFYQRKNKNLNYGYNYSWFIVLFMIDLNINKITEYLLNCKIYQHLERNNFIKEYFNFYERITKKEDKNRNQSYNNLCISDSNHNLLYNLSLQYQAFDLTEKAHNLKKDIIKKIWYSPKEIKTYKKFLEEETINQIKEIQIDCDKYECTCDGYNSIINKENKEIINILFMVHDKCNEQTERFWYSTEYNLEKLCELKDIHKNANDTINNIKNDTLEKHYAMNDKSFHISTNDIINNIKNDTIEKHYAMNLNPVITNDTINNIKNDTRNQNLYIKENNLYTKKCPWKSYEVDKQAIKNIKRKSINVYDIFLNRKIDEKYTKSEILLSKIINEYLSIKNNFNEKNIILIENLINLYLCEKVCSLFLCYIYKIINALKEYSEDNKGDGMKEGTGDKNISEDVKNDGEIQNDGYEDKNEVSESDGIDISNEGNIEENEDSIEFSQDEIDQGCDSKEDEVNEDIEEDDNKLNGEEKCSSEDEGDDEMKENDDDIDDDIDDDNVKDIDEQENNEENLSEHEESDGSVSEGEESIENNFGEYKNTEDKINNEQTCENADNYFNYVSGNGGENNIEEGEGEERIEKGLEMHEIGKKMFENNKIIETKEIYNEIKNDSFSLANYLKNILEGNKRSKFIGNYKSGKKLNMKKIVPFILSEYKKDKIWLRRRREDKREYKIRIFIDVSKSMNDKELITILFNVLHKLTGAFEILNMNYDIYKFGSVLKKCEGIKDFINNTKFDENETSLNFINDFKDGINLILTDGIFQGQCEMNDNFLLIMVDKKGIKDLKRIIVLNDGLKVQKYLESVKIKYCTVENVKDLENEFIRALSEMVRNIFS